MLPTWRDLWKQRTRWQRGALQNLRHYGWSRTTARYWGRQAGWRARLVAAPLALELCYDLFIQAVFVRSLIDLIGRRTATWPHVAPSSPLRLSEAG